MPFPAIAAAVVDAVESVIEIIKDSVCALSTVSNQNGKTQNTIKDGSINMTFIDPKFNRSK
ncbi:MAG: hypothetical protein NTX61_13415 [Bacteroidetes bacterium]|nr:hypothetical protein [Bacteroidota bacterium]